MKKLKGFTLIELVIVIGIIAIVSAILIPKIFNVKKDSEDKIVDIYNDNQKVVYIFDGHEISEEESKNYKLERVEYKDGIIYEYFVLK